ncbi:MAG: hypothetical protein CVT65_02805 [Actinobacteria bacterium HGW-Actinobacteria-5]|jgi:hypothetical protein|nr:MAG: hypothetical protein CVT65_02805 [Actinobacteria bacterium HGW-Actinobacteria-5]
MSKLADLLAVLENWEQPLGSDNPLKLSCRIGPGASDDEITEAPVGALSSEELRSLWSAAREAWLFEDTDYGQWGLHLLSPSDSAIRTEAERSRRPEDMVADDVVLGEFLGDSELLVYAPSSIGERRYLIALPLDSRRDWFAAGTTVVEVLQKLIEADGDKYWEPKPT